MTLSKRTAALSGPPLLLVTLCVVLSTAAFRCPGNEPAAGDDGGAGGTGGAGTGTTEASSSSGPCVEDIMNDVLHCGACGHACSDNHALPGMTFCAEGHCVPLCEQGYADINHPVPPAPDDGCEANMPPPPKMIFLSKAMVLVSTMGGLPGADALCDQYGQAIGAPPGIFKAWLGDSINSPEMRLTHSTGPYLRPDGLPVANNWDDLVDGTLLNPPEVTEDMQVLPMADAWTGADPSGKSVGPNCGEWISGGTQTGITGRAGDKTGGWTYAATPSSCLRDDVHLYCIEQ